MTEDDAAGAALRHAQGHRERSRGAAGRPIVGLTTSRLATEDAGVGQQWDATHSAYAEAIAAAGGLPVLLPSPVDERGGATQRVARRTLETIDGLVLTGGGDVDPARYGQVPHPATRPADQARDEFELALVHAALAREIPLLGLCRGAQVLCVAMGADLLQDVETQGVGMVAHARAEVRRAPVHEVELAAGSALAAIYGTDTVEVNSTHHQAPGRLGGGLIAVGHSPDGVVEAVELPSAPWVIGVQWHPEELWKSYPQHALLFEAFVRAAAEAAQRAQERAEHAV